MNGLRYWWCEFRDKHKWQSLGIGKRVCSRCGREEWLFVKRYPHIDEPAAEWRDMSLGRRTLPRQEDNR